MSTAEQQQHSSGDGKGGTIFLAIFLLYCIIVAISSVFEPKPPTPAERAAHEANMYATATAAIVDANVKASSEPVAASATASTTQAWGIGLTALAVVVVICLLVLIAYGTYALIDAHRLRRHPLIQPDDRGLLPFNRQHVQEDPSIARAALAAFHNAQQAAAAQPQNYSPHIVINSPQAEQNTIAEQGEQLGLNYQSGMKVLNPVPDLSHLYDSGLVGLNKPMLLGFENGVPIQGTTKDLLSTIVAGLSGSGKTNTTMFLLVQAYLANCLFLVADPHGEAEEDSLAQLITPLADAFAAPIAMTDSPILSLLELASSVIDARLRPSTADKLAQARSSRFGNHPVVVVVDEVTAVLSRSSIGDQAAILLEKIFAEGRKVHIYGIVLGQSWLASRSGGNSALRDTAATKYVHRLPRKQSNLLLPTDLATQVERLGTGQAILARRNGTYSTITIPLVTEAAIERTKLLRSGIDAQVIATSLASSPSAFSATHGTEHKIAPEAVTHRVEAGESGLVEAISATAELPTEVATAAQIAVIRRMLVAEQSSKLIIAEVFGGGKELTGDAYQKATIRLRKVVAYIVGGGK